MSMSRGADRGPRQGVLHCTIEGSLLSVDRGVAVLLGYSSLRTVTRDTLSILEFYADPADRRRLLGRLESGLPGDEARWLRADGTSVWVRTRVLEVQDWDGRSVLEVAVEEVTDRRHVEERLRSLQRMEGAGAVAGAIAHDFRDQLTAILGHLDLLEQELPGLGSGGDRIGAEIAGIREVALRGARMVDRLTGLGFGQRLRPRRVRLDALVAGQRHLLDRLLPSGIELRLVSVEPVPVAADPSAVEQMLLALVTNARDAMGAGGRLTLETGVVEVGADECRARGWGTPGAFGYLAVSDTGPGIPPEVLARGFHPVPDDGRGGRVGRGLPVCYGLMKQHRGFMDAGDEVGGGALVRLLFPLAEAGSGPGGEEEGQGDRPGTEQGSAPTRRRPGGRNAILVVDDDPQVRRAVSRVLSRRGYPVLEVSTGDEAVRVLRDRADVGALLVDLVLPGADGAAVVDAVRAQPSPPPVVFTGGFTDEELARREQLPDDTRFLSKPWRAESLLAMVEDALGEPPGDRAQR